MGTGTREGNGKRMSDPGVTDGPVYTDPDRVVKMVKESDYPKPHQLPADGYGNKIPTSYRVLYDNGRTTNARHWHRVYVICYSNSGSAYILVRGQRMFIDTTTEHQLLEL